MSLKDQITKELKSAMKVKNTDRLEVLRFLLAQIKNKEITLRPTIITDQEVLSVVQKQAKQRQEGFEQFQKAGRQDLAEKEKKELAILKEFLPQPLTQDELEKIINNTISSLNQTKDNQMAVKRLTGQIIKTVIEKAQGRADSKTISHLVKTKMQTAIK